MYKRVSSNINQMDMCWFKSTNNVGFVSDDIKITQEYYLSGDPQIVVTF